MAQQDFNLGTPNGDDGNFVRDAFEAAQANFTELYGITDFADRIIDGSAPWTGTGLVFDVIVTKYLLNGNFLPIINIPITDQVTLSAADPTNPRIDIIVVNEDETISVIEGTPAATPVEPTPDFTTQLKITSVLIPATATVPGGGVTQELVYDENVGEAAEWTATESTGGSRVDLGSTNTPDSGSTSIQAINMLHGDTLTFTNDATVSDLSSLNFRIRVDSSTTADFQFKITLYDGVTIASKQYAKLLDGLYGYVASNTDVYQSISININKLTDSDPFDTIEFEFVNLGDVGTSTFNIDDVSVVVGQENNIPVVDTSHEGYNDSGTRAGGDLVTSIGDYDDSGFGQKLVINDVLGRAYFEDVDLYCYNGLVVGEPGGSFNGFTFLKGANSLSQSLPTLTSNKVVTWQDATGTVALLSDIGAAATGLEVLNETNGNGWRLIGRTAANYGNIGLNAVDISVSTGASSTRGATGENAFAHGEDMAAGGDNSAVIASYDATTSGYGAAIIASNFLITASGTGSGVYSATRVQNAGDYSAIIGGDESTISAAADKSVVLGGDSNDSTNLRQVVWGNNNIANSENEAVGGMFALDEAVDVTGTARLFGIGSGTSTIARNTAFAVRRNGTVEMGDTGGLDTEFVTTVDLVNEYFKVEYLGDDYVTIVPTRISYNQFAAGFAGNLDWATLTSNRVITFPDSTGTVALLSDTTLQAVTDQGKTTTNDVTITGAKSFLRVDSGSVSYVNLSTDGTVISVASDSSEGFIVGDALTLRSTAGIDTVFNHSATGTNKTVTFQDLTGTVALLSDLSNVYTDDGTFTGDRTITIPDEGSLTITGATANNGFNIDAAALTITTESNSSIKSTNLDNQIKWGETAKLVFISHRGLQVDLGSGGTATPPAAGDVLYSTDGGGNLEWKDPKEKAVVVDTTTSYGFVLSDANDTVTLNNAGAVTAILPAEASIDYPIGTEITIINLGAGTVTVSVTTDTINQNVGGLTMAQYDKRTVTKVASATWVLGY